MKLPWMAAIAAASILVPLESAFAQEPPGARRSWTPEAEQSRAGVEVDFLHDTLHGGDHDLSVNLVTADLTAQIGVTKHVFIDADIPTAVLATTASTESMFGNPFLGAHYAGRFDRRTSGYVGASFGLPLARASKSGDTDQLGAEATVTRVSRSRPLHPIRPPCGRSRRPGDRSRPGDLPDGSLAWHHPR